MVYLPKKEKQVKVSARVTRICPVCEGKGKVNEMDEHGNTVEIVCPGCDGSGFVNV